MVTNSPHYAVHMIKKTAKSADRFFIVTQVRRDELGTAAFHGIGYWTDKKPNGEEIQANITEVWIPWDKIDHVESLVYRQRS
jgi:hypothetical protein